MRNRLTGTRACALNDAAGEVAPKRWPFSPKARLDAMRRRYYNRRPHRSLGYWPSAPATTGWRVLDSLKPDISGVSKGPGYTRLHRHATGIVRFVSCAVVPAWPRIKSISGFREPSSETGDRLAADNQPGDAIDVGWDHDGEFVPAMAPKELACGLRRSCPSRCRSVIGGHSTAVPSTLTGNSIPP